MPDIFLLLFPHASMDIGWCNYELGRFTTANERSSASRTRTYPNHPQRFNHIRPMIAVTADTSGGLLELFVSETFTDGIPLNHDVGQITEKLYERAHKVSQTNWHRNSPRRGFENSFTKGELYFPYVTTRRNGSTPGVDNRRQRRWP